MIQLSINNRKLLFVEIPEGVNPSDYDLLKNNHGLYVRFWDSGKDYLSDEHIPEETNWQILCRVNEVDDEIAKGIVERDRWIPTGFKDYNDSEFSLTEGKCFKSPMESFRSLLKANKIQENSLILTEKQINL